MNYAVAISFVIVWEKMLEKQHSEDEYAARPFYQVREAKRPRLLKK
jgi:hypothetical protein